MGLPAYFAGSINGNHWEGQRQAFDSILAVMEDCGLDIISQHGAVNPNALMENYADPLIYEIDCEWINQSQCMVAEGSGASFGVGYEVGYAIHERHIPVLVLHCKGQRHSAMFSGNKHLWYREYDGIDDIIHHIQYFTSNIISMSSRLPNGF